MHICHNMKLPSVHFSAHDTELQAIGWPAVAFSSALPPPPFHYIVSPECLIVGSFFHSFFHATVLVPDWM